MRRSRAVAAVVVPLLAMLVALAAAATGERPPGPAVGPATGDLPAGLDVTVERVVDGDTVVVSGGERVRLIGVDTPETRDPNRPVGCFGREASDFTARTLREGTGVRLVGDVQARDRFDRLLAYAYRLPDGLFVNAELVRQGYALPLTIPPNVAHAEELVALAGQARQAQRGLWAACPSGRPPQA